MGQFLKDPQAAQQEMQQMINNNVNRIVDIGTNLWNNRQSRKLMREQMQYQMLMQQQAQIWQEKMWNEANAYNDPKNQRARLEAAGINPAMALGGVQGASAQSMTSPSAPSAPAGGGYFPMSSPVDRFLQSAQIDAMLAASRAQTEKTQAEADLLKSQLPYASRIADEDFKELLDRYSYYKRSRQYDISNQDREDAFNETIFPTRVGRYYAESRIPQINADLLDFQRNEAHFNSLMNQYRLDNISKYQRYDLQNAFLQCQSMLAQIAVAAAQKGYIDEQAKSVFWNTFEKTFGVSDENNEKNWTPKVIGFIGSLKSRWQREMNLLEHQAGSEEWREKLLHWEADYGKYFGKLPAFFVPFRPK